MREIIFAKKRQKQWAEIEQIISSKTKIAPDRLSELYIELTDDLAHAQTNYPGSKTTTYVNQLSSALHQRIYRNKKEKKGRIKRFWVRELPLLFYEYRKALFTSLIVFSLSCIVGAFSAANDDTFVRFVLGDAYVNQTLENIEMGKPMAIYEGHAETEMFLGITINNVRVSFITYAAGILLSLGSGYILFRNGLMLGCFQYFFYSKQLLFTSVLSIWVHGTLEITAIIVAGGAGIAFGNGFLFPGTMPRLQSFQKSAVDSVKIILGLVPIFITAGFLEGFVTRHADIAPVLAGAIILCSIIFVLFYFVYYPYYLHKTYSNGTN